MQPLLIEARRKSPLSLTPLIDVVFILLLFFMLTSSFVKAEQLSLSGIVAVEHSKPVSDVVKIVLRADGALQTEAGAVMSDAELASLSHSQSSALLLPHTDASVQQLIDAFSRLNQIGVTAVAIGDTVAQSDAL